MHMTMIKRKRKGQQKKFEEGIVIRLYGEDIPTGPGTVPTSLASVSKTSIDEMIKYAKKASELGVFDKTSTNFSNEK
jgi:hypothetical protein